MPKEIDFQKVKEEVKAIVSEITEVPEEDLKEEAKFVEDLGVDSMLALEVVASIEKKYRISIPEGDIIKFDSLNNVYKVIKRVFEDND